MELSRQLQWEIMKLIHKEDSTSDKKNYGPISIHPIISKIYERCLFRHLNNFFNTNFSKFHCRFRQGFSIVNCLLPMIEKWRESIDQHKASGAFLTDLSKAFDSLPHDFMISMVDADVLETF